MTHPRRRRAAAAVGLLASLAGLPLLLQAAVGPPRLTGLPGWGWVVGGLRDQYLPVDPLLVALGLLAWALWAYALLAAGLRVVAVVAARRGLVGSAGLLAVSNLVTVRPLRSLVDAAVGVSLLASAPHVVAAPAALAGPTAVVRTLDTPAGWGRAGTVLGAVHADPADGGQLAPAADQGQAAAAATPAGGEPGCPPAAGRVYVVQEGDSLWRIAERELGDGHRWRELFARNQGRRMPDGRVLRDGGLILPGWQLLLPPPDAVGPPPTTPRLAPAGPGPAAGRPEPPPPPPAPSTAPATPPSGPTITSTDQADGQQDERRDTVELPSGSMVGISLAVGIAAALAVAGLRHRRRRRPLWPSTPPSRAVRPMGDTARLLAFAAARATHLAHSDRAGQQATVPAPVPRVPGPPRDPRDPTPARVTVAEQHGREVGVDLAGFGAIGITGPGADSLARACLVGLLAAGDPTAVEVLLVGDRLIPAAGGFPGLRRAAGLPGALNVLEAELVHRARLLEGNDIPDFAAHRRQHPDDPLPALVMVADGVSLEQAGRLAAILAQGPRLGVGALLPGTAVDGGAQLVLDDAGRVQAASPWELGDQELVGARACALTQQEAAELLGVLARSRTDDDEEFPASDQPDRAVPADLPAVAAPAGEPDTAAVPAEEPTGLPEEYGNTEALVTVRLLGPMQITTPAGELRSGLRASARELLAYYLVHPDGATLEQAVEAMWPDTELGRERERFWTALGNLRSTLRKATGQAQLKAIERDGARYRVDPGVFTVDLWRFQQALAAARRAQLDPAVAAALAAAGEAYGGVLLDGAPYAWVEIPREDLRRRAVDALARLAELRQAAGDLEGALTALEQAVTADPVAEELYRRVMRLEGELGRPDAVKRTYRLLARRLADLDVDPDAETERLVADLLRRPGA
jgi:DNA-binding SARP family transcriptional activator